jgi:N-acetylmuramoyl-L-alanine amidase
MRRASLGAALGLMAAVSSVWAVEYRVRSGDTLSEIAARFNVSVEDLKARNRLTTSRIDVGDVLQIPGDDGGSSGETSNGSHTVRDGESLWLIALKYRVTIAELRRANGLRSDVLQVGQRLTIPGGAGGDEPTTSGPRERTTTREERREAPVSGVSREHLEVLARIVKGEMPHDGCFEGKVAVAAVVLNRVRHPAFPKSIPGVAHQPLQFSCYNRDVRRRLYNGPIPEWAWEAARAAVNGRDPSNEATHYFNPYLVQPSWARTMRFLKRIGTESHTTHDFYRMRG